MIIFTISTYTVSTFYKKMLKISIIIDNIFNYVINNNMKNDNSTINYIIKYIDGIDAISDRRERHFEMYMILCFLFVALDLYIVNVLLSVIYYLLINSYRKLNSYKFEILFK